ncbi:alpha/beta hydrolase [Flavobacterium sp. AS60]|uniref:alpha/beta hydrolase n=1 Tax=Flavobacterium anseongense TaxID=2910677 RepID=UPI001F43EF3D|nr:alpha/beta hydrolase [Flavobacterium sp. AS60]MCF6130106.1 alpha/beta hydrolase [Flavobacterium sp. AS60]
MKNLLLISFCLLVSELFSQTQVDTSYTVWSTYNKEVKKFPFIKKVQKPENKEITKLKEVVYKSINSRELHLDAYFKQQETLQPAVILIHGGGWSSGNKSQMNYLAQEIASKGYACFGVEYRLTAEAKYPAAITDVKEAIKYIKDNALKFNVDPTKVAVLGCSSGGQMAALIGTTNGNLAFEEKSTSKQNANVQAIIDMDGILAFHHPESAEGKAAALWLNGTYEENPQVWEQASALNQTDEHTPPILFINSSLPRFHAGQNDMIEKLNKYAIYNEVKALPNSPHSFWFFEPWFDEIVLYSTQFLDKIFKQQ